jgi:hypothetical protein
VARTLNPQIRNLVLYPVELWAPKIGFGSSYLAPAPKFVEFFGGGPATQVFSVKGDRIRIDGYLGNTTEIRLARLA